MNLGESHHLFIYFKAVYYSINRDKLYVAIKELAFHINLIRLVRRTVTGINSSTRFAGNNSDTECCK